MRVLYFTRDYTPHDHRFLSALAETDHQVYSLRLERMGKQTEERPLPGRIQQVNWRGGQRPFQWRYTPSLVKGLRDVIRSVKPDLVHAGPIQNVAFLAALAGFRPLVSMSWGSDLLKDAGSSAWMRWVTRFTLQHSTVLVGDCQAVSNKAQEYGMPSDRIILFPWGVDLQVFCPGMEENFRAKLNWQNDFVLLSTRAWEPLYGVDVLVTAFARAARQIPELRLVLLGGGSREAEIKEVLSAYGVMDRVFFGGQVTNSDLPNYYRGADVYLSASHSDGSSVSLMEALACGKPVIVSDIPGNLEWVTPGQEGWLFTDGDSGALESSICEAFQQRGRLIEMGKNSRKLALKRADWKNNFLRLLEAYDLAIKTGERSMI